MPPSDDWFGSQIARRNRPTTCSPVAAVRRVPRPREGRALVRGRATGATSSAPPALDPDARGLAADFLPRATDAPREARAAGMTAPLRYAVITPVRNEARTSALAATLGRQTVSRSAGSSSTTARPTTTHDVAAEELEPSYSWIAVSGHAARERRLMRGAPIVERSTPALDELGRATRCRRQARRRHHVRARLLRAAPDANSQRTRSGIASGSATNVSRRCLASASWHGCRSLGANRPTAGSVSDLCCRSKSGWAGILSTYSRRQSWAGTRGGHELPFRHHRPEGARDGRRTRRGRAKAAPPTTWGIGSRTFWVAPSTASSETPARQGYFGATFPH